MSYRNIKDASNQKKDYLIFGSTKTGKTLLSSTLPASEVVLVNTENNLDSLYGVDMYVFDCFKYSDFVFITDEIINKKITPKWFYLDSITDLMTKVFSEEKKKTKDGRQVYSALEDKYNDVILRIKTMPCNVVVVGRMTKIKDEITGGMIFGAAMPWAKLENDLPFNFSAVLATRSSRGDAGKNHYAIQCHPCSQYQVGVRTQFGKENPLSQYEEPNLMAIHNKITA